MSRLEPQVHPLLTEEVVEALYSRQIYTALDFAKADTQQIIRIARLNFREVLAVKNFLLKKFSATPINGFDCYKTTLNNTAIIPTGLPGVDNLLDGGLLTGNIYEICGLPASGKTRFVLNLMKNVVCNTEQEVYLFDTKNDFSAMHMKKMLKGHDQAHLEKYLSKMVVNRTYTRYDLINSLYEVKDNLASNLKLRLIIIDSLPSILFSSNNPTENNAFFNHLVNLMRYIATEHYCAFFVTNLIRTWRDSFGFKNQNDPSEKIACGKYWYGVPNTRLKIEKLETARLYRVTILSSNNLDHKVNNSADFHFSDEE